MLKQRYLGGDGGDLPNTSPKPQQQNEHPALPDM